MICISCIFWTLDELFSQRYNETVSHGLALRKGPIFDSAEFTIYFYYVEISEP